MIFGFSKMEVIGDFDKSGFSGVEGIKVWLKKFWEEMRREGGEIIYVLVGWNFVMKEKWGSSLM